MPKRAADHTSYEVRRRWDQANQKVYGCRLRLEADKDIIDYIEAHKDETGTSELFRAALREYMQNH